MIPSFNIEPGETSAATAQRRRVANALLMQSADASPVRHWSQAVARAMAGAMGGYEAGRADKAEKDTEKKKNDGFLSAIGIGGAASPAAAPVAAPAPTGIQRVAAAMPATSGKVYENNEPSPLDPPSGQDRDMAIRTVLAESGNQPPVGQQAVAAVLRNRAVNGNFGGDKLQDVIQKPNQFEPHNTPQGRARMAAIDPNSPAYAAAGQAVERAYAGEDPTKGATHFYAPKAQAALGRPAPKWDNGTGADIGDHRFFGGAGTPQVTAGASPTEASAQARQPATVPAAPQTSRNAPTLPPAVQDRIRLLVQSGNRDLALAEYQKYMAPSQPSLQMIDRPDGSGIKDPYLYDAATGKFTRAEVPGQTSQANAAPGAQQPAPAKGIPPAPPGVNVAQWNKTHTESLAKASTGELNENQGKATQFAGRMENAEGQLGNVEGEGVNAGQRAWAAADSGLGAAGFGIPRGQLSDAYKTFDTARSQWITALLRRESGAAIAPQEFSRYDREFFPQPGDGPAQIQQKREARRVAIDNMKKEAGGGYQSPQVASRGGPQVGTIEDGYRFKGGNPADPNSWEQVASR